MLLPSAFGCEQPQRATRPKLPSFTPFEPPSQPPLSGPAGILASCRALHSILGGGPVQALQSALAEPATIKPLRQTNPFTTRQKLQPPPRIVTPPRGANKRRRDEFEEESSSEDYNSDSSKENLNAFQTPKRRRRTPLELPMGLNASDFDVLNTPSLPRKPRRRSSKKEEQPIEIPQQILNFESSPTSISPRPTRARRRSRDSEGELILWSPEDDRRLIEVVLGKLNLSTRDWNDCAQQLGKDKASLGRRWNMLVGEGNVGLRRGSGVMERTGLDVESW